jgi:hypothetical protein
MVRLQRMKAHLAILKIKMKLWLVIIQIGVQIISLMGINLRVVVMKVVIIQGRVVVIYS